MRRKEKMETSKYTLLTNLQFVTLNGVRTFCRALLITQDDNPVLAFAGADYTIRGFGTEAAWPVFDVRFRKEDLPYTLAAGMSDNLLFMTQDGAVKPLITGAVMEFKSGLVLVLEADDADRPIDVTYEAEDIGKVWRTMWEKTAAYWKAPRMPRLTYGPPSASGCKY
jgi:hypothetical protein